LKYTFKLKMYILVWLINLIKLFMKFKLDNKTNMVKEKTVINNIYFFFYWYLFKINVKKIHN